MMSHSSPLSYGARANLSTPSRDVVVVGAGASGLMCACTAARRGLSVTLLDAGRAGRKIAISGGGRANFTNRRVEPQDYVGEDAAFCAHALERWTPDDMLSWMEAHGLPWEERDHGRLFCRVPAPRLVEALVEDCTAAGAVLRSGQPVTRIQPHDGGFVALTPEGPISGRFLVLAAGSPAWPQAGASEGGWRLARALGHSLIPARPILTPLRMPPCWPLHGLAGISLAARLEVGGHAFTDQLLFTHQGISGPAALQASCHWRRGVALRMDFLPDQTVAALLDEPGQGKKSPRSLLARRLPQRLVDRLLPPELARRNIAELSRAQRRLLHATVHAHSVVPADSEGFRKAEAAAGGVATAAVDPYTMESLLHPGLFLTGELLDVTGHLGGYNLHWAWASGRVAGESLGL